MAFKSTVISQSSTPFKICISINYFFEVYINCNPICSNNLLTASIHLTFIYNFHIISSSPAKNYIIKFLTWISKLNILINFNCILGQKDNSI